MKRYLAAAPALLLAACAASPPRPPPPDLALVLQERVEAPVVITDDAIRLVESQLQMPTHAAPLAEYDRYYAGMRLGAREGLQGVLLLRRVFGDIDRGGMAPVEGMNNVYRGEADALPLPADGGCSVVTFYFDLEAQRFVELYERHLSIARAHAVCNGNA